MSSKSFSSPSNTKAISFRFSLNTTVWYWNLAPLLTYWKPSRVNDIFVLQPTLWQYTHFLKLRYFSNWDFRKLYKNWTVSSSSEDNRPHQCSYIPLSANRQRHHLLTSWCFLNHSQRRAGSARHLCTDAPRSATDYECGVVRSTARNSAEIWYWLGPRGFLLRRRHREIFRIDDRSCDEWLRCVSRISGLSLCGVHFHLSNRIDGGGGDGHDHLNRSARAHTSTATHRHPTKHSNVPLRPVGPASQPRSLRVSEGCSGSWRRSRWSTPSGSSTPRARGTARGSALFAAQQPLLWCQTVTPHSSLTVLT